MEASITVKLLIDVKLGYPAQTVMEMISEVFGKEEMKDKPRATLVHITLVEIE